MLILNQFRPPKTKTNATMKDKAQSRLENSLRLLNARGIKSLQEFMNSVLVIHISFKNEEDDGVNFVIKPQEVHLYEDSLEVDLEKTPLEINLGRILCSNNFVLTNFEDFTHEDNPRIVALDLGRRGWSATWVNDPDNTGGALGDDNLRVQILRPQ